MTKRQLRYLYISGFTLASQLFLWAPFLLLSWNRDGIDGGLFNFLWLLSVLCWACANKGAPMASKVLCGLGFFVLNGGLLAAIAYSGTVEKAAVIYSLMTFLGTAIALQKE
jgi:hypothetical protein